MLFRSDSGFSGVSVDSDISAISGVSSATSLSMLPHVLRQRLSLRWRHFSGRRRAVLGLLQRRATRSCRFGAGISITRRGLADTGAQSGHHDLHAASGASGVPAASCANSRRIRCNLHPFGIPAGDLGGDVDRERAELDEAAVPRERPAADRKSVV